MKRRALVLGLTAGAIVCPGRALATGGLDVGDPGSEPVVRVLLASGQFAPPAPLDAWSFAWEGRTYRGTPASVALPGGRTGLVDAVPLDAYLYGVLGRELDAGWPGAAQRAQAIVARTYARLRLRPQAPYDVAAGSIGQGYRGIADESPEGRGAVDATAGLIVSDGGAPAKVAYSACCGGHTADAALVWGTGAPYLRGVADPYCTNCPDYDWSVQLEVAALTRAFGADFAALGNLTGATLGPRGLDTRPQAVGFTGATGSLDEAAVALRNRVGPGLVRSAFYRSLALDARAQRLTLAGTGLGHGVGLCQWGARGLAATGASAQAIVAFYFPGTTLARA